MDFEDNASTTVDIGPNDGGEITASITVNAATPMEPGSASEPPYIDLSIRLLRDMLTVESHHDMRVVDVDDLIEALTAARDRAVEWAEARGVYADDDEPLGNGAASEPESQGGCTHPSKGGQERVLGSGTGDYHCCDCGEAMPIINKPSRCTQCRSTTAEIVPDPAHGKSWRCNECGKNWGWVYSVYRR